MKRGLITFSKKDSETFHVFTDNSMDFVSFGYYSSEGDIDNLFVRISRRVNTDLVREDETYSFKEFEQNILKRRGSVEAAEGASLWIILGMKNTAGHFIPLSDDKDLNTPYLKSTSEKRVGLTRIGNFSLLTEYTIHDQNESLPQWP